MNDYVVYRHIAPNGKVYIGITKQTPSARWKNGKGYQENGYFYAAILKYGWDAFTHEIVSDSLSKEEAEAEEIRLIKEHNSTDRRYGYNIASGGMSPSPSEETKKKTGESVRRAWEDQETRERMSAHMRGKTRSDKGRRNISNAQKKRFENPSERARYSQMQIGKHNTAESNKKRSESLKRYYQNEENKQKYQEAHKGVNRAVHGRKVICLDTCLVFDTITDAASYYGIERKNISAVCAGRRSRAGGYRFAYTT